MGLGSSLLLSLDSAGKKDLPIWRLRWGHYAAKMNFTFKDTPRLAARRFIVTIASGGNSCENENDLFVQDDTLIGQADSHRNTQTGGEKVMQAGNFWSWLFGRV